MILFDLLEKRLRNSHLIQFTAIIFKMFDQSYQTNFDEFVAND
jgi:hypothetical protein